MASILSRASRDLARAARQVSSAARRAAPVTIARPAPSDLPSRRLSVHSGATDANIPGYTNPPPDEPALWALYERWCEAYNEERDHDEMVRRFDTFKEAAFMVDRVNKANLPYTLKLSQFADGKLAESVCNKWCGDKPRPDPAAYHREGEFYIYDDGGDDVPKYPTMRFLFCERGGPIIPLE
ncbi:hypothetical protein VPH35_114963 [Triticum aestivum]